MRELGREGGSEGVREGGKEGGREGGRDRERESAMRAVRNLQSSHPHTPTQSGLEELTIPRPVQGQAQSHSHAIEEECQVY